MPTSASDASRPTAISAASSNGALAAAFRVVSGLTLLSRFAGLARDVVTARVFGDDVLGSAFRAAYAVPNLFRRLFGEGALSAAFLPEYTLLRRDHPDVASQLATIVVRLLTLVTGILTIIFMLGLLAALAFLPMTPDRSLSLRLMLLMIPMMPAVCLTAILGGMLQAHGKFAVPAAAPILLNAGQILAGIGFYLGWSHDRTLTAYLVGAAAVLASAFQIVWSLWALRGQVRWEKAREASRRAAGAVFRRFVPSVLGLGTLQLNTFIDMTIAMWPVWVGTTILGHAVTLDEKSNAILSYTQTIYQFPLGVFGIAVATAVFPMLSRCADKPHEFMDVLRRAIRLSLFIGLPATVGLWVTRDDLIFMIFGGGRYSFTSDGLSRAAAVLGGFAPGVWAYSLNHVWTRAFYAKGDTRTPMKVAIVMVVLNFLMNITLVWPLREAGLAWSTAIAAMLQCVTLGVLCRRLLGESVLDGATMRAWGRIILLSVLMGAVVYGVAHFMPGATRWREMALRVLAEVVAGAIVYAAGAFAMRLPELRWLFERGPRGSGKQAGMGMNFD